MSPISGQSVLITGAAHGIGAETARRLAARGARVSLVGLGDLGAVAADCPGSITFEADVTDRDALDAAVNGTVEAFGGIDVVVWNGGGPPPGTAADITDETLEGAFALLLGPPIRLVRLCLPHLQRSPAGRVLCITSTAVIEPVPHLALSNTLRPGVTGWAKTLSRELGPNGITVNCVAPGRIDTPRMQELYGESGPGPEVIDQIPLGRLGTPREFGDVVCFLASDRASYVSGTTVLVDGGGSHGLL